MFQRDTKVPVVIPIIFEELLTGDACVHVAMELIKYVMLQKQQMPLSYDCLLKLSKNPQEKSKNLTTVATLADILKKMYENLQDQFISEVCDVKEIVILIGTTIFTPKLCIKIELPSKILQSMVHKKNEHCERKVLIKVMRSLFQCTEFQDEMAKQMPLTNTFVLVQKKDSRESSTYFLPKPQFNMPNQRVTTFNIKLNYNDNVNCQCKCENLVKVYDETRSKYYQDRQTFNLKDPNCEFTFKWYQSKEIFKGFKLV